MNQRDLVQETRERLRDIATHHQPAVFTTSFGAEDMVLLDLIEQAGLAIEVVTLDTGRLPAETYELMQRVRQRYRTAVRVFYPDAEAVARYVERYGPNGFYDSLEARKACCAVRKLEPLARALAGKRAWITGLRREQAVTRTQLPYQEYDATHGVEKFNPLADWRLDEVWDYIHSHQVPYNALHDRHYPSIGCAPCTRAVTPGEDIRAGRWWWENPETKECGLHRRVG